MSAHLVAGSAPARLHTEPKVVEPALLRLLRTVAVWMERSRQRRALAELADANDHLLADLSISQAEARDEAAKPFWAFSRAGEVDPASLPPTTGRKVLCASAVACAARSAKFRNLGALVKARASLLSLIDEPSSRRLNFCHAISPTRLSRVVGSGRTQRRSHQHRDDVKSLRDVRPCVLGRRNPIDVSGLDPIAHQPSSLGRIFRRGCAR
jgi:uncharacterized protein YjiS (DUF1127 family)